MISANNLKYGYGRTGGGNIKGVVRREKGERRREKGERRKEKGERRKEKGKISTEFNKRGNFRKQQQNQMNIQYFQIPECICF